MKKKTYRYYTSKDPELGHFHPLASRYLEMERKLRGLLAQRKVLDQEIRQARREMEDFSFRNLGYLGHTVVDRMRKERKRG